MPYDVHAHLSCLSNDEIVESLSAEYSPCFVLSSVHSLKDYEISEKLMSRYRQIRISAGIHPINASLNSCECMEFLEVLPDLLKQCDSVGEIGYDIHPSNRPFEEQRFFFKKQIEYAIKFSKPVVIHCRNAFELLFEDLSLMKPDVPIIIHGYSGGFKYINDALKLRCHISFGLPISWNTSSKLKRIAAMIPKENLLVETDSPFCFSYREGGRSLPSMVSNVISALARARNMEYEEIDAIIGSNVKRIFNID